MPLRLTEITGSVEATTSQEAAISNVLIIDASDNSPYLYLFLDMIDNPCNYRGKVIYLTAIGPTPRPDPFLWIDKFYFNEGCEWHESPFSLRLE